MSANFRAMCAELIRARDSAPTPSDFMDTDGYGVIDKIRTALAEPEPKGPTDNELEEEFGRALLKLPGDSMNATAVAFAHAVLARWGCQ